MSNPSIHDNLSLRLLSSQPHSSSRQPINKLLRIFPIQPLLALQSISASDQHY